LRQLALQALAAQALSRAIPLTSPAPAPGAAWGSPPRRTYFAVSPFSTNTSDSKARRANLPGISRSAEVSARGFPPKSGPKPLTLLVVAP
jgi:hypothetical protein